MTTPSRKPGTPAGKRDLSTLFAGIGSIEPMYEAVDLSKVRFPVASTEPMPGEQAGAAGAMMRSYTVAKGDTLSHIAKHFYGKAGRWREIFEANRDQLDHPDQVRPGQVLKIPADRH